MNEEQVKLTTKENIWITAKYFFFVSTAAIVHIAAFTLLRLFVFNEADSSYGWSYFIALLISVTYSFTINRRYTFKSISNITRGMLLILLYYLISAPLVIFGGQVLSNLVETEWFEWLIMMGTMMINSVIEYIYQRLVIHKGTINTNELARKDKTDTCGQE